MERSAAPRFRRVWPPEATATTDAPAARQSDDGEHNIRNDTDKGTDFTRSARGSNDRSDRRNDPIPSSSRRVGESRQDSRDIASSSRYTDPRRQSHHPNRREHASLAHESHNGNVPSVLAHPSAHAAERHGHAVKAEPVSIVDCLDETLLEASLEAAGVEDLRKAVGGEECPVCMMRRRERIYGVLDETCNHWMCYVCAIRLRAICSDNRCPICRDESQKIFLTNKLPTGNVPGNSNKIVYKDDDTIGVVFATESMYNVVQQQLLRHKCPKCSYSSAAFSYLELHVKDTHQLFYCHTCLQHLKLFTYERRCYGKQALSDHIRLGDMWHRSEGEKVQSAFNHGHPKCQICSLRSFDRDELLRHNRREHHICYCCEWGPKKRIVVFEDLPTLRKHMKKDHFVCDFCHVDPPRAFNDRHDLELHQVESHHRRDLSAELCFDLTFRRADAFNNVESTTSASDNAVNTTAVHTSHSERRRPRDNGLRSLQLAGESPTSFAAQPEEFPTISGTSSRDPLETMLCANRLIDSSHQSQYPPLAANNVPALNSLPEKKTRNLKKTQLVGGKGQSPSSARQQEHAPPRRRLEEFPALPGNPVRLPVGMRPPAQQQSASAVSPSQKKPALAHAGDSSFATRVQQNSASGGKTTDNEIKNLPSVSETKIQRQVIAGSGDAPSSSQQPLSGHILAHTNNTGTAQPSAPGQDFPVLGPVVDSNGVSGLKAPRWIGAENKPVNDKKAANKKITDAAVSNDVAQAALMLKRLTGRSQSAATDAAVDAADRYNQYLASDLLDGNDENDERGAFPQLPEHSARDRASMGPWWRRANEGGGKKKGPKSVWKRG